MHKCRLRPSPNLFPCLAPVVGNYVFTRLRTSLRVRAKHPLSVFTSLTNRDPICSEICLQVGDGQAALDRLVSGEFDMLVLDLGLPKKQGMEVLAELRSMPATSGAVRDIPVIVSSGHVLDETRRLCLEAG